MVILHTLLLSVFFAIIAAAFAVKSLGVVDDKASLRSRKEIKDTTGHTLGFVVSPIGEPTANAPSISFIIFGDEGYTKESYTSLVDRIFHDTLKSVEGDLHMTMAFGIIVIAYGDHNGNDEATNRNLLGKAVEAMAAVDQYAHSGRWVAIAHGKGGTIATTLVAAMQLRIKVLVMLGALTNPFLDLSKLGLNLYTLLIGGVNDHQVKPEQVIDSAVLFPLEAKLLVLQNVSHSDFADGYSDGLTSSTPAPVDAVIKEINGAISFSNYPGVMEEGLRFLQSGPRPLLDHCKKATQVEAEFEVDSGDKDSAETAEDCTAHGPSSAVNVTVAPTNDGGYIFAPSSGTVKAGIVFLQGAACPPGSYGSLLSALAERGYLCVAISAVVRDAYNALDKVYDTITGYQQGIKADIADGGGGGGEGGGGGTPAVVSHWFVSGHSLGGSAASQFAFNHPDLVKGVMLFAGSAQGYNFTEAHIDLPFFQVFGSRDTTAADVPVERYVTEYLEPWVPKSLTTTLEVPGGAHYTWGYYGYQSPFFLSEICRETQIIAGVNAAVDWADDVLQLKLKSKSIEEPVPTELMSPRLRHSHLRGKDSIMQ